MQSLVLFAIYHVKLSLIKCAFVLPAEPSVSFDEVQVSVEQAVADEEQKMLISEADAPFPVADLCHFHLIPLCMMPLGPNSQEGAELSGGPN